MARKTRTKGILQEVGHELKENAPAIVSHTRRKFGVARAEKQRRAILLSKARRLGARVRRKS